MANKKGQEVTPEPGLPDGIFSNQKSQFGQILEGIGFENVDIFNGHLVCFTDNWDFYDIHLVHFVFVRYIFSSFGIMYQENLATLSGTGSCLCNQSISSKLTSTYVHMDNL
jgi:hypothetical protein